MRHPHIGMQKPQLESADIIHSSWFFFLDILEMCNPDFFFFHVASCFVVGD